MLQASIVVSGSRTCVNQERFEVYIIERDSLQLPGSITYLGVSPGTTADAAGLKAAACAPVAVKLLGSDQIQNNELTLPVYSPSPQCQLLHAPLLNALDLVNSQPSLRSGATPPPRRC
jgi:hypothetical protein